MPDAAVPCRPGRRGCRAVCYPRSTPDRPTEAAMRSSTSGQQPLVLVAARTRARVRRTTSPAAPSRGILRHPSRSSGRSLAPASGTCKLVERPHGPAADTRSRSRPAASQRRKKSLRVTDASDGVHASVPANDASGRRSPVARLTAFAETRSSRGSTSGRLRRSAAAGCSRSPQTRHDDRVHRLEP